MAFHTSFLVQTGVVFSVPRRADAHNDGPEEYMEVYSDEK